jgi:hypothetical protein
VGEPGGYEIRAMGFAEILDVALRLVRSHFVVLTGCAAVLYLPLALVSAALVPVTERAGELGSDELLRLAALFLSVLLAVLLLSPIVTAAITHALSELFQGRGAAIAPSLRVGLGMASALIATWGLASLAILGPFLLPLFPWAIAGSKGLAIAVLVGVSCPMSIYVAVGFLPLTQAMVVEGVGGAAALGRSYDLMAGHRWRGFGLLFVCGILTSVLQSAATVPLAEIPPVQALGSGLAQAVGFAFMQAVNVLLYFDLRCRRDGFGLEQLPGPGTPRPAPIA